MSRRTVYRLIWIPSAVALVAVLVLLPGHKAALSEPTAMTAFTPSDGSFTMQRPGNWDAHELSSHGTTAEVQFTPSDDAFMRVTFDLTGSLMADINRSIGGATDSFPDGSPGPVRETAKSPLEKLHEATGEKLGEDLGEFKQGTTTKTRLAGYDALATDFTYVKSGEMSETKHAGYYLTALTGERCLTVVYHCTADKGTEAKVMPTFEKMAKSIRLGQQGGQR